MILLFKLITLTVIIVLGLKIAMSDGMLLERLGRFFERKIDEGYKVFDLFYCQWCMSTLSSIVAYFFAFGLNILPFEWDWQLLIRWPLIVMGGSIVAGNIWNVYLTINQIKDRNEVEAAYYKTFFEQQNQD